MIYTDPETYEKTIDRRWVEYRRREKQCVSCKKNFHTIETPELFFNNVTDRVVQLAREVEGLKGRLSNESTTTAELQKAIGDIIATASAVQKTSRTVDG